MTGHRKPKKEQPTTVQCTALRGGKRHSQSLKSDVAARLWLLRLLGELPDSRLSSLIVARQAEWTLIGAESMIEGQTSMNGRLYPAAPKLRLAVAGLTGRFRQFRPN